MNEPTTAFRIMINEMRFGENGNLAHIRSKGKEDGSLAGLHSVTERECSRQFIGTFLEVIGTFTVEEKLS